MYIHPVHNLAEARTLAIFAFAAADEFTDDALTAECDGSPDATRLKLKARSRVLDAGLRWQAVLDRAADNAEELERAGDALAHLTDCAEALGDEKAAVEFGRLADETLDRVAELKESALKAA